jgi:Spy/CpxP family protein refolding chaperone
MITRNSFKLLSLLVAGLFACSALAQVTDPNKPVGSKVDKADKKLDKMTKKLELTTDQQNKIRPILQDEENQIQAVMKNNILSREQKKEQIKAVSQSTKEKIDPLLTPDQREDFDKMKKEKKIEKEAKKEARKDLDHNNTY